MKEGRGNSSTDKMVEDIEKMLYSSATSYTSGCYIFRVPKNVRELNEAAYTPLVVSIGPYHYNERRLQPMEEFKRRYCMQFIERRTNLSVKDYVEHVRKYENLARSCYEENLPIKKLDFVAMILVDACFIIEFMLRSKYCERDDDFNIPSMQLRRIHINHDLVLLENQLPYLILHSLYDRAGLAQEEYPNFDDLVFSFFDIYKQHGDKKPDGPFMHFTDFIRALHEPTRKNDLLIPIQESKNSWQNKKYEDSKFIFSATQLHDAGVKFQSVTGKCLLDIDFDNQCLSIPCFELNDDKESLFRNLMALELHHYPYNTFIIDYFVFMDTLIDTPYDVNLLVQKHVLLKRSGDYWGAAESFNIFCEGITHYNATSYLIPIYRKLNEHYKEPRHAWMASLKRDYFKTPWIMASTITAVILLVLTFIGTVCSVISIIYKL